MNNIKKDFRTFAKSNGTSMSVFDSFTSKMNFNPIAGYISPTILEERQLNVTQMDVFSRLMMDRIIFLGTAIDDDVSNIITSQLLYLDQSDKNDIHLYINSPGGVVYGGYGIYDVMHARRSGTPPCWRRPAWRRNPPCPAQSQTTGRRHSRYPRSPSCPHGWDRESNRRAQGRPSSR